LLSSLRALIARSAQVETHKSFACLDRKSALDRAQLAETLSKALFHIGFNVPIARIQILDQRCRKRFQMEA